MRQYSSNIPDVLFNKFLNQNDISEQINEIVRDIMD